MFLSTWMNGLSLLGGDLNTDRKLKQSCISVPVQCLRNLKERELSLKKIYNITAVLLLWEFCIQVAINMCNSESSICCCWMGGIGTRSNWITHTAIAMKHLFAVCETTGKTELCLLCCNVWLFPWGNPKTSPWSPRRRAEGSVGSHCAGSCCSQPGVKGTGKSRAEISVWCDSEETHVARSWFFAC